MSEVSLPKSHSFSMPWGAWHGDLPINLTFPEQWEIAVHEIKTVPELSCEEINAAIENPIGTQPLREQVKGKDRVVIAVEDITRPTCVEKILEKVLSDLHLAGVTKDKISIVICNGAHAPMLRDEIKRKLGDKIVSDFLVINHNPYDNLSDTGIILGKTPVRINRFFYESDFRITIGSIIPHNFAGFSAGAKLVLPGLADIATLERTHKYVMMGFRGGVNDVETNKFRSEIESVVSGIGLDFFIGVVPNGRRHIAGVFAGDMIAAHRAGVAFARKLYQTPVEGLYDVAILNAYPKDAELLQADSALTPFKTEKGRGLVTEDGVLVIISKCSNGYGHHNLFGPGMRLSKRPNQKGFLGNRELIVFSPEINKSEFLSLYWDGYYLENSWQSLIDRLISRFPKTCRVAIFPCAPFQVIT